VGSFLVFESLPIGKQKVAISRIYQKRDDNHLDGSFVSLYDPSVETFNSFRNKMGLGKLDCENELEVLENEYAVQNPELASIDQFIESYVETYDSVLDKKTGEAHSFGLKKDEKIGIKNDMEKVQNQPKLTSAYINAIKSLDEGRDRVSHGLVHIDERLGLGFRFREGDAITIQTKRRVLQEVIRGITSAVDRADVDLLFNIEQSDSDSGIGYAAVSYYGNEARSEGVSYESEACPESSNYIQTGIDTGAARSEFDILQAVFNPGEYPPNFGNRQIGICKTKNCPTRKKPFVTVGGCGFCLSCHHLLEKKDPPEKVYHEIEICKKEVEGEVKRKKEEQERLCREKEDAEKIKKQKALKDKQKFMQKMNQRKKPKQKTFFEELDEMVQKAA
jgi:hypothetical protein